MDNQFSYDVKDRYTIEARGNILVCIGHTSWNDGPYKLELRKWVVKGDEVVPQKGVTMTHEGADKLAEILIKMGYGDTAKLAAMLTKREDYMMATTNVGDEVDEIDTDMYSAGDLLKSISK